MERDPSQFDDPVDLDEDDADLLGDPDDVDHSIEEQLDERLQDEDEDPGASV